MPELTTRYRYMILSVDGESDTKTITNFINNKFITRDTKCLESTSNDNPRYQYGV